MNMVAKTPSGHEISVDGAADIGGANLGARPMEMVLTALGGCTSIDVLMILGKMKVSFDDFSLSLAAKRREEIPKVFTEITMTYSFSGADLPPEKIKRAILLSEEKYCSVSAMLTEVKKHLVMELNGTRYTIDSEK